MKPQKNSAPRIIRDGRIGDFLNRVKAIDPAKITFHGFVGQKARAPLHDSFKAAIHAAANVTEADLSELAKLEDAARSGDGSAKLQLHKLRVDATQNWVVATAGWMANFAEIIVLADDETPYIRRESMNEVAVAKKDRTGRIRSTRFSSADTLDMYKVPLFFLGSNPVEYPIWDIYSGSIKDSAVATFDIAQDWALAWDKAGKDFMVAANAYGGLTLTGNKQARAYATHSYVNTDNLPIRNDLNVKSTGTIIDICVRTCAYTAGFGDNAFKVGKLFPTGRIRVPSGDMTNFIAQIQNVSVLGQVNELANKLIATGVNSFHFNGVDWSLESDNTLAPGTCYPVLSRPPLTAYLKPSGDKYVEKNAGTNEEGTAMEERSLQKPVGFELSKANTVNALKVSYTGNTAVNERTPLS